MEIVLIIIIIAIVAFEIVKALKAKNNHISEDLTQLQDIENSDYFPYHKKLLLTKNEYYFYKRLKELTDSVNLQILAKVRLADLIEVNNGLSKQEWSKYFSKIKAKHIDFAIVQDMKIVMLIELDDNSHSSATRETRDYFVEKALTTAGHLFVRTYGDIKVVEKELYKLRLIPSISNN